MLNEFAKFIWKAVLVILKIIAIPILVLAVYVAINSGPAIFSHFKYGHSFDWKICKQYMWIFKDSIKNNVNPYPIPCASSVRERDIYNIFSYIDKQRQISHRVLVWEFKDLSNFDLNKIVINQNVNLNNVMMKSLEVLDTESFMPVTIRYGFEFKRNLSINLNESSKIDGFFSGANYKGFYGNVDQMSFTDETGQHQIFFGGQPYYDDRYDGGKKHVEPIGATLLLLYKGHGSFYVIIFSSYKYKPFKDASIIDILNLT